MIDVPVVSQNVKQELETAHNVNIWSSQIEYADDCRLVMAADSEDDDDGLPCLLLQQWTETQ